MGRIRGILWLTAGLIVAIVAGFVAFVSLSRAEATRAGQEVTQPKVEVVVATHAVPVRGVLSAVDLEVKEMPVDTVPEGALRQLDQAVGRVTLVDLYAGEVILEQRLMDPNVISGDGRLALLVAEDEVLMALEANDLMSKVGILKPGDHVDLLFTLDFPADRETPFASPPEAGSSSIIALGNETEKATFNLLQDVTIAAIVAGFAPGKDNPPDAPNAILLTIDPQDALVVKYVKDAGGILDLVLRAPGADQPYPADPVDVDYIINRYQIPTETGR